MSYEDRSPISPRAWLDAITGTLVICAGMVGLWMVLT